MEIGKLEEVAQAEPSFIIWDAIKAQRKKKVNLANI